MTRRAIAILLVTFLAAQAGAQDDGQKPQRPRPTRLQRGDAQAAGQESDRFKLIARQLQLDEQQKADFEKIVAKYRDRDSQDKSQRLRELVGELRQANEAGDTDRVQELRGEMRALRRGGNDMNMFLDEIEPLLREDQRPAFDELKQRFAPRAQKKRGDSIAELRALKDDLELDDQQGQQWDARFTQLQEDLRSAKDGGSSMELIQQIMEAAEAGDDERVKQLREQLPNPREQIDAAMVSFLADVRKFLRPEQIETLDRFQAGESTGGSDTDLRACFRFVGRLDLDRTQREAFTELRKEAQQAERETRRDESALAKVNSDYQQRIRELLTPEQAAEFDRWLDENGAKENKRGPRRGGMRDRARGGNRGADQP